MQDFIAIAALLREISFGILLAGLFYTFGMFLFGKVFAAIAEHGDIDHDVDHNIDHGVEHDVDHEVEHEIDHDFEHEVEHDLDHDVDHDVEHEVEHGVDHHVEHEAEHESEHDTEHEIEISHEAETDHSGFFELERGAPLGVTIGTGLVLFGFLGSIFYYEGIIIPLGGKVLIQLGGTAFLVWAMRTILGRVFVESGFNIQPKHLLGLEVEAVSTIRDDFGEIRAETEMGLRRFYARPFQKGIVFQKGTKLFVVSANEKFVYVDPRKEAVKWVQKQSKSLKDDE